MRQTKKKKPPFYTEVVKWIDNDSEIEQVTYFSDLDEAIKLADSINDPNSDATVFDTETNDELYFHYTDH